MSVSTGPAIRVEGLVKLYRRTAPRDQFRTLKSALVERSLTRNLSREESIVALDGIDFEVARGEAFGVVGGNGSGKSTLLKLIAGMIRPSSGHVRVAGRVAALIELGAGFHPEISGRENVYINGAVLGLSKREVDRRFDQIVEFSGLAEFMEEPVKNYSSGMYVRLGFAVAIHTDPDILLVDEVLAVGDEQFSHRCLRRIEELLVQGKTVLFVSHSLDLVAGLCDRALWLEGGRQRLVGNPRRAIDAYRQEVAVREGEAHRPSGEQQEGSGEESPDGEPLRWGSREAEITAVRLWVGNGAEREERYLLESGTAATFEIDVRAGRPLDDFVFGIAISTPRGVDCWGTNTDLAGWRPARLEGEGRVQIHCPALRLAPGEYRVDIAVHARDGAPYDYRRQVIGFTVTSRERGEGVYFPEHKFAFEGGIVWQSGSPGDPKSDPAASENRDRV